MNKICNFYISEKHLNVVLFEYVKRQLKEGTKIIVISQDSKVPKISSIKDKFKKKNPQMLEDFLDEETLEKIYNNEKVTIIVKGDNNFIEKVEENLTELLKEYNIDILSCYNILESDVNSISKKYNKILNTTGLHNIQKNTNLQKI